MNKLLIDTNIFVYEMDQDSQFFHQAKSILDHSDVQLITTSKNLVGFSSFCQKASELQP